MPAFEPLVAFPQACGCDVQPWQLLKNNGQWQLDLGALEGLLQEGVQWLVLNFPHNPTGMHIRFDEQKEIVALCEKYHCNILSDEVFRGLENVAKDMLPSFSELTDRAVSISVMSKAYALPGVRVGWIATQNPVWRKKIIHVKSSLSICTGMLDDAIATEAVNNRRKIWSRNRELLENNRAQLHSFIHTYSHLFEMSSPQAACTALVELKNNVESDAWYSQLLNNTGQLFLPGSLFYASKNTFRFGFGRKDFSEQLTVLKGFIC